MHKFGRFTAGCVFPGFARVRRNASLIGLIPEVVWRGRQEDEIEIKFKFIFGGHQSDKLFARVVCRDTFVKSFPAASS